ISVKLRRHRWRGGVIPTADDDATWERLATGGAPPPAPGQAAELLRGLRPAAAAGLSPPPRGGVIPVALKHLESDARPPQLQSTRGAVYKVLHDARRKLRQRLEREGHLEQVERT